jgi:hypothetical protein
LVSTPPPSEPDVRISRIRLSSRWFYPRGGLTVQRHEVSCKLRGSRLASSVSIRIIRPAVRPTSSALGPSPAVLAQRHYRRFLSAWIERHVSTFLHPFAPPALPGFIATMSALTPAWRRDSEARSAPRGGRYLKVLSPLAPRRSPRFTCSVPPEPSVSNHPTAPHDRFIT